MSACIGREGEYSEHVPGKGAERFVCQRCGVFDEDGCLAALEAAESARDEALAALEAGDACGAVGCRALAERDEAVAVVERVRELAATWLDTGLVLAGEYREAAHHILAALTPSAPTEESQA